MTLKSILKALKNNNLNSMETKMEITADGIGDDILPGRAVIKIF